MAKNIHRHMRERCQLAYAYAEDGAFHSAARVLRELATQVEAVEFVGRSW